MRVSYKWLKEYVDCDLPALELADKLTMAGIVVETVTVPVPGLDRVIVGKITEMQPHPDSDHLNICLVDTGSEVCQFVSGAPNIFQGANVPVARPGIVLPTGGQVEERAFRGQISQGVLCSGAELGTEVWGYGDEKGILIMDPDLPAGIPVDQALGLDDWILEFELTPNRGDCLAVINIAREVKALTGGTLHLPEIKVQESDERTSDLIRVSIEDAELCRRYTTRVIRNVTLGASPEWMQYRLRVAGIRPINNIVDVTNFVMVEMGQPLHAFNYDMLHGAQIVVRRGRPGEMMASLDGVDRELNEQMLVIGDAREAAALAGVMGGLASEVTAETHSVLLESAVFDPLSIRLTAQALTMRTEASLRFEKEINIEGTIDALNRATQLIEEMGAGVGTSGVVDEYIRPAALRSVRLRTDRVNKVLGTELTCAQIGEIIDSLDFESELSGTDNLIVSVPPYRVDIVEEVDLIEEIARLYGYDRIEPSLPTGVLAQSITPHLADRITDLVTDTMVSLGLDQVITYSFIGESALDKLNLPDVSRYRNLLHLQNPLREEQSVLRPLLLPGLVETVGGNWKRKQTDLGFFEVGVVFASNGLDLQPDEKSHLGIAACGNLAGSWQEKPLESDFYYLKGLVEALLDRLGIKGAQYRKLTDFAPLHPGRAAAVYVGDWEIGYIGELHPNVLENYELPARVLVCEIDLASVAELANLLTVVQPQPRYPGIFRDLAVVVPDEVPASRVEEVIAAAGGELLRECRLFDLYQGKQVQAGYRSLAYALLFQSPERTLTDEEVSRVHTRVLTALEQEVDASLR
jgi:phenylalanyl-tRNA synthetase beta chain